MVETLQNYQRASVEKVVKTIKSGVDTVIIADEVGLGKTWEVFGIIDKYNYGDSFKVLIITPSEDLIEHWKRLMSDYSEKEKRGFVFSQNKIYSDTNKQIQHLNKKKRTANLRKRSEILVSLDKKTSNKLTLLDLSQANMLFFSGKGIESGRLHMKEKAHILQSCFSTFDVARNHCEEIHMKKSTFDSKFSSESWIKINDKLCKKVYKKWKSNNFEGSFKKLWIEEILNRRYKPDLIIVDEFHKFPILREKQDERNRNFDSSILKRICYKHKTILLSATPFRPVRAIENPDYDPISAVLLDLSSKYQEIEKREQISNKIERFNTLICDLRNYLARTKNLDTFDIEKTVDYQKLLKLKKEIEATLKLFIFKNKRKVPGLRKKDKKPIKNDLFKKYLEFHELLYHYLHPDPKYRTKKRCHFGNPFWEVFFTAGWGTLFTDQYECPKFIVNELTEKSRTSNKLSQNDIDKAKKIFLGMLKGHHQQFIKYEKEHDKIKKYEELVKKELFPCKSNKNFPLWLPFTIKGNGCEKFVLFCNNTETQHQILDMTRLWFWFPNSEKKAIWKKSTYHFDKYFRENENLNSWPLKCLKNALFEIESLSDQDKQKVYSELKGPLAEYFTSIFALQSMGIELHDSKNVYDQKVLNYCRKYDFENILIQFLQRAIKKDELFEDLKSAWRGHHHPVYGYGVSKGDDAKSRADMYKRRRGAFNTPFFPFALISTNIGSEGVDLHKFCRNVLHYDTWWMPSRLEQRAGRVDRVDSLILRTRKNAIQNKCENQYELDKLLDYQEKNGKILNRKVEVALDQSFKNIEGEDKERYRIREYFFILEKTVDKYIQDRADERQFWVEFLIGGEGMEGILKGNGYDPRANKKLLKALIRLKMIFTP